MRASIKTLSAGGLALLVSACASAPVTTSSDGICYRPHWPIPFEIPKLQRGLQRPFTTHTGLERFLTIFKPGPFVRSLFFVMSPEPSEESVTQSPHFGVMLDTNRDGSPDCFILAGGTLPDAKGRAVPYNFFAIDWRGTGQIEEFISEDLDLDGDRVMDRNAQAVMAEPDPEDHFQVGAYLVKGTLTPIPKEGSDFVLKKPILSQFHFPDNEVTQMTLFAALQKIWDDLQHH